MPSVMAEVEVPRNFFDDKTAVEIVNHFGANIHSFDEVLLRQQDLKELEEKLYKERVALETEVYELEKSLLPKIGNKKGIIYENRN